VFGVLLAMGGSYVFGVYSSQRDLWPIGLIRNVLHRTNVVAPSQAAAYGQFNRLVGYPGKTEVPCPPPAPDTAVILAIGQSNAANHAGTRIASTQGNAVLNLFEGKCYGAASPLLGASGEQGEFITLLGDKLVANGIYKKVVLVSAAVSGTPIGRWRKGGDLNDMLQGVLAGLPTGLRVTQVVWVQGENDSFERTPAESYAKSFASLLETLPDAPVFIAIATRCGAPWQADNPAAQALRRLPDNRRVYLGADLDGMLTDEDRQPDRCHLGHTAQLKAADSFATAITRVKTQR
jgi:hypothetical protein